MNVKFLMIQVIRWMKFIQCFYYSLLKFSEKKTQDKSVLWLIDNIH